MTRELNLSTESGAGGDKTAKRDLLADARHTVGAGRSPDLESMLPQGHPARLCWEHVSSVEVASQIIKATHGVSSSIPLFALWLFASARGVGSAEELAWLCQNDIGFRWLSSGLKFDARGLAEFRGVEPQAADDLMAQCLVVLRRSGAVRGDGKRVDEEPLLARYAEALRHLAVMRKKLADPIGERLRRRERIAEQRRALRSTRIDAARADFRRLTVARAAEAERRLAEQRAAEQRAAEQRAAEQRAAEQRQAAAQSLGELRPQGIAGQVTKGWPQTGSGVPVSGTPRFVSMTSLDWEVAEAPDDLYRRVLTVTLALFAALSTALVLMKPPPVERLKDEKIPQRLTRLFDEQKVKPALKKPKLEQPLKLNDLTPKDITPADPQPEEKPAPKAEKPSASRDTSRQARSSSEETALARERAAKTGLVAMRDQLAAMRDLSSTTGGSLRLEQTRVGSEGTQRQVERDLIGRTATSGSGGVATKGIEHSGGGMLQGRSTSRVSGPVGAPTLAEVERETKGGKRTHEEIKLAFDANKSAIYGIYRRALRENPLLEGRVVLKLTIDPSGQVTACSIVSSALKDPDLEAKLVARIQLINFGTRPKLETWTGTYQIDFVPAS